MIRNDDYFEIIKEQNKELAKFRPFKSAYEMKQEIERLNNIINELKINLRQKGIEITIYDQPNYEKISGYVSITMTPEQLKKELKGDKNNDN